METEGTSLDDILSGAEPAAAEPVQEAAPEPQEADGQPRGPDGKFLPKQETGVETPQEPVEAAAEPVPPTEQAGLPPEEFKGLKDERRKRQEAEARVAALEAQLHPQQQVQPQQPWQQQTQPQAPPDRWEDPEGHDAYLIAQAEDRAIAKFQQIQTVNEVQRSFSRAKTKYGDFDEVFDEFDRLDKMSGNLLTQQALTSDDPAEFAYKTAKTAREVAQYGSVQQLLAAERAKWEAEARAAITPPAPSFPSSTVTDRSLGGRTGPAWAGPASIGDILST